MLVRKIVHIDMDTFMRQWSSGMIRNCAANPSQSRDATAGPSSAPLPMMRDVLACVRRSDEML